MLDLSHVSVRRGNTMALDGVSLSLDAGETLSIVGESGAGKSTLIAAILGLVPLYGGTILWDGKPLKACRPGLVMQEPRAAFNPRLPLRRSVLEPLVARHGIGNAGQPPLARLTDLCAALDLPLDLLNRLPGQVSIGQVQRMGIVRALIAAPPLILFDEPLSALDAVTQKRTARLIADLQARQGFAALIVTHDLGYALTHSDHMAVLKSGRLDTYTPSRAFASAAKSPYCQSLYAAAKALGALPCP